MHIGHRINPRGIEQVWITWKDRDCDLDRPILIDKKIDIFYQQAFGWQLHVADLLANGGSLLGAQESVPAIPHSGFAVLHVCLSYFETIGRYQAPVGGSRKKDNECFKLGAKAVFPWIGKLRQTEQKTLLDVLWKDARCGLYHRSRTARGVGLGQPKGDAAMEYHPVEKILCISPERLARALKGHLEGYRACLLDPANATLRRSFEQQFDEDFGAP